MISTMIQTDSKQIILSHSIRGLSVGEINTYDINQLGTRSNVIVITYYDSIQNFSFSSQNGSISWNVPFDWDTERFKRDQSILVHQEVKVPKRLAASSTDVFVGKVNRESASR